MEVFAVIVVVSILALFSLYGLMCLVYYIYDRKVSKYWYHPKLSRIILRCKCCSNGDRGRVCDYDCIGYSCGDE